MTERNKQLQQRLDKFVISGIELANNLPSSRSNLRIIPQFIDSVTSCGANYREACEAESAKDFVHKIKVVLKELQETNYWLQILGKTNSNIKISSLEQESLELIKIFSSVISKFKQPQ